MPVPHPVAGSPFRKANSITNIISNYEGGRAAWTLGRPIYYVEQRATEGNLEPKSDYHNSRPGSAPTKSDSRAVYSGVAAIAHSSVDILAIA